MRVLFLSRARALSALALLAAVAASGCGPADKIGKTVPVSGKVLSGGAPLTGGMVQFHPAEGNPTTLIPFGPIDKDGKYTLKTSDGSKDVNGAPLGKYKVTVTPGMGLTGTVAPAGTNPSGAPPAGATPDINPRYTKVDSTNLNVEVVESGGQYDLSLLK